MKTTQEGSRRHGAAAAFLLAVALAGLASTQVQAFLTVPPPPRVPCAQRTMTSSSRVSGFDGRVCASVQARVCACVGVVAASESLIHPPTHPPPKPQAPTHLFNGGSENQMMEDGQTVSSLMEEYNAKQSAKRQAEDEVSRSLSSHPPTLLLLLLPTHSNHPPTHPPSTQKQEQARLLATAAAGGGGVAGTLRTFTESKAFLGVEAAVFLATLALVDGAWSGDWVRYDYISQGTEQYMKSCSLQIAFAHLCLAGLGGVILDAKGRNEGQSLPPTHPPTSLPPTHPPTHPPSH